MAFEVHTPLGLGTVTETDVVRGRTSYKVAGRGFDKWFDETEITKTAWAPVDHDNSVALPYDPTPQYPAIPGDVESTLQPIHGIDADERLSPADSITFDDRGDDESDLQVSDNFLTAAAPSSFGTGGMEPGADELHEHWMGMHGDSAYPHESPYYDQWSEGQLPPGAYRGDGASGHEGEWYNEDGQHLSHDGEQWNASPLPDHMASTQHEGFAFLIPLAEGLAGAAGGAGAAAGAEAAGMGAVGQGLARGVGSAGVHSLMGGDDAGGAPPADGGDPAAGGDVPPGDGGQASVFDRTGPGTGWGPLISHGSAIDQYLAAQEKRAENVGAGLSDKYIDLTASADYHNDPVAQFRHDPIAYIERTAHVEYEPISPEMEHYGQLVEANANIREAAWADVRSKAMRLRREGRIDVKDVAPDRIYASVEGDHGTYDVMIAKEGAFGGFGGGHAISNWRCGCEWGRWAFQRRLTYVGRLCSHGYATYMEMQSQHTKGQERLKKLHRYKKADALQNEPQRLVPDMVINDTDDSHIFQHGIDVTKDERDDTGPDDIVSDQDIVHFARVMGYCDRHKLPYPRELTAFLVRHADDENPSDWRVEDAAKAEGALNEIRDWSDSPLSEDLGHLEERNDKVRDAVDEAREKGTDASLFTAGVGFRTADSATDFLNQDPATQQQQLIQRNNPGYGQPQPPAAPGTPQQGPVTPTPGRGGGGAMDAVRNKHDQENEAERAERAKGTAPAGGYDPNMNAGSNRDVNEGGGNGASTGRTEGDRQRDRRGDPGAQDGVNDNERSESQRQIDRTAPGGQGAQNRDDQALPGGQNYNSTGNGAPAGEGNNAAPGSNQQSTDWTQNSDQSQIGQGQYTIQQGDTLADIAQRSGYGDNYQALGDQNGISNYDMINAGGTLNIGKPGDPASTPGQATPPAAGQPGGPVNQNSGPPGADDAPGGAAAAPPASVATPAAGAADSVDLGATGTQSGSGSGGVETGAATQTSTPAAPSTDTANQSAANTQQPSQDSSNAGGGAADFSNQVQSGLNAFNNVMDTAGSVLNSITGSVFTDQADYDEWVRYAYPDSSKTRDHKPFNGSGGEPSIEFGTSEEYADKARKNMDDVWDLEHHNVNETDERFREGGVKRLGGGPRRTVTPEVVREQRPTRGGAPQTVQASMEAYASFDPLAARTPESFDDDYDAAAVHIAAQGGDIVAAFQRQADAGGSAINAVAGSGGQFDDFANSPAVRQAMMRTAGRNYSLAEQHELIREGDRGGAGNLASLDLRGTHYEDDAVGLFT